MLIAILFFAIAALVIGLGERYEQQKEKAAVMKDFYEALRYYEDNGHTDSVSQTHLEVLSYRVAHYYPGFTAPKLGEV